MEGARVGIFEDDGNWHVILTRLIERRGHSVVAAAGSMAEAQAVIEGLEPGSLDVAVVDGNLDPRASTGADGAEVTRLLREKVGGAITVIGFSGSNQVEGVDHNVSKVGDPVREIPAIIAEI